MYMSLQAVTASIFSIVLGLIIGNIIFSGTHLNNVKELNTKFAVVRFVSGLQLFTLLTYWIVVYFVQKYL